MSELEYDPVTHYECANCHGIFQKGWSDSEAIEEALENFGADLFADKIVVICDDCYDLLGLDEDNEETGEDNGN